MRVKHDETHLGIMPLQQALDMAWNEDKDLVEIVPNVYPPICAIMDYAKYKFEEKKKKKDEKAKTKPIPVKEIRLRPVSAENDVDTKINQAKKFLEDKHPLHVVIIFKSREMQFKELGFQIIRKIIESLSEVGTNTAPPKFEGTRLSVRINPK